MPCSPITSNLMTSIYELESELKGKNELCDYLCYRFYNRAYGPTKRWPLWDISVIAYMINLLVTIFFHAKITIPLEHIFMHCSIG